MTNQPGLREADIRPDDLMAGQAERFAADVRRLLAHKARFVAVRCPACDADDPRWAFDKCELAYQVCAQCGTMYISPRPPLDVLAEYYATSENYAYWNKYIFPASEAVRRLKLFRPRAQRLAELCRRFGITGGTLLEVGAGFGTFCEEVRTLGLFDRVIAVEPTPGLAETCRNRGLEVIEQPIEEVDLDGTKADVVAAFEVLEHLFSPAEFLTGCRERLADGGLLLLSCPNGRGFDVLTLGELSNTVDVEHLNYFHPDSLAGLARRCEFEVLDVLTPGELDAELVRRRVLAGEVDLSAQPFLNRVLVDDWERLGRPFQRFLSENGLSSHMWLIARKASA
jgi:2-polyprenyl-3-methyl-5-hydroxy-6-metoxy-1,4-benzoquinol methylase/ribosomal protein S27E